MENRIDLSVLSGNQRVVVLLHYFGGLSEREVGEELSELLGERWSRDRVRSQREAAIKRLRAAADPVAV